VIQNSTINTTRIPKENALRVTECDSPFTRMRSLAGAMPRFDAIMALISSKVAVPWILLKPEAMVK